MTEAAHCPDVTGRWPGYWLYESDVADVDELPPVKGTLSILLQDGPQIRGEATTEGDDPALCVRYPVSGTIKPDGTARLHFGEEQDGTLEPQTIDWVLRADSEEADCEFTGDCVELTFRYRLVPRHRKVKPQRGGRAVLRFRGVHRQAVTGLDGSGEGQLAHVTEFERICSRLRHKGEEPTLGRVFDEMFGRDGNPLHVSWHGQEA